jgi:hypothetical protein
MLVIAVVNRRNHTVAAYIENMISRARKLEADEENDGSNDANFAGVLPHLDLLCDRSPCGQTFVARITRVTYGQSNPSSSSNSRVSRLMVDN